MFNDLDFLMKGQWVSTCSVTQVYAPVFIVIARVAFFRAVDVEILKTRLAMLVSVARFRAGTFVDARTGERQKSDSKSQKSKYLTDIDGVCAAVGPTRHDREQHHIGEGAHR